MGTKRGSAALALVATGQPALLAEQAAPDGAPQPGPSIAVLLFTNAGALEDAHLCPGITEDIVAELSRFREIRVTSSRSSFRCEPFAADTKRVARELGCRHVLEGSIRRAGDRLRITTRLLDGLTGELLSSDRYDGPLADVLAVQEDIAHRIAGRIAPEVIIAELNRAARLPIADLETHDMVQRARALILRGSETDDAALITEGLGLVHRAAERDPDCAEAYRALAWGYSMRGELGFFGPASRADYAAAEAAAQRLRELNPSNHAGHAIYGHIAMRRQRHGEALASLRHAHELNPNATTTLRWLSWEESNHGLADEARRHADLALRLSPRDHMIALGHWVRALADYVAGDLPACAENAQRAAALARHAGYRLLLTACLAEMDRAAEAREVVAGVMRTCPGFVESRLSGNTYFARADLHERYVTALRRAADGDLPSLADASSPTAAPGAALPPALAALTEREREVLRCVSQGNNNRSVAEALGISEHTAKRHVANILMKLDLPTRTAAAALAARHGLG